MNIILTLIGFLALHAPAASAAPEPAATAPALKVVTSTTDLRAIAEAVGGDRITATSISEGYQDPHFVEPKPSFILDIRDADVFAFVGLDLEIGWMPLLINGARNPKVQRGGSGYLDVSRVIPLLGVAQGEVDRSGGDVHPRGNPHYWLNPDNARLIAQLFAKRFAALDPAGAATYVRNEQAFEARLDAAEKGWAAELAAIRGKPVVAWHTSWRYFADYTGLNIIGYMEPKPGVPPSPSHLVGLIQEMKRTGARLIIMEPFYDRKMADFVAARTDAEVLILPPSVGGAKGVDDYITLMQHDISQVARALR
ncbi:MAG TPA: metal ABC transporter substrate-binding protein [Longimicrobiaceae bacterium]|nr:metal ABC transporter substrate-binding protein [Longimicrobiaceae bacterium]